MQDVILNMQKQQVMSKILTKLRDDLFSSKVTRSDLASYIGIAKSTLSDILNEHTEVSFIYLIKMIMKIYDNPFPDLKDDMIMNYLIYAKPENRREALEYSLFQRDFDFLNDLIAKDISSKTEENQEWARVYGLIYKHLTDTENYDPYVFHEELEEYKIVVKTKEMKVLIDILICQTLYQLEEYKVLFKRIGRIEKDIKEISNKYIRSSFQVRLREGINVTYLMQNKIEKARKGCISLLEVCDKHVNFSIQKSNALFNLGESYIFENYVQSKHFLERSLLELDNGKFLHNEKIKRKARKIQDTLTFLKIYHYRDLDTLPNVLNKDDQVFFEFKNGNLITAELLLCEILNENGTLDSFTTCYLGLVRNDRSLIEKSYRMFLDKNNLFYANLPKLHLGDN
ncbi:AimR family lysis-lysogeny pheromone receptor [Bacillus cereus]|uniref:AimR family lysis-lysogeny pheromone receptor n=1 Tax=Bacillus cereus TaxID=1396 RepID=UPI003828D469